MGSTGVLVGSAVKAAVPVVNVVGKLRTHATPG